MPRTSQEKPSLLFGVAGVPVGAPVGVLLGEPVAVVGSEPPVGETTPQAHTPNPLLSCKHSALDWCPSLQVQARSVSELQPSVAAFPETPDAAEQASAPSKDSAVINHDMD
jgi:hypothetical protein